MDTAVSFGAWLALQAERRDPVGDTAERVAPQHTRSPCWAASSGRWHRVRRWLPERLGLIKTRGTTAVDQGTTT
jgi:hypothetical protein